MFSIKCAQTLLLTLALLLPVCLFSAVLYLNDDFDGGEFFFADREAKKVTVRLNFPYSLNVFLSFRSMFIHFS